MMDSINDDLAGVQLRRHNHPGDHGRRGEGGGVWNSRSASRMGAVRRSDRSTTLPQSSNRNAVFGVHVDERLTVSEGDFNPEESPSTPDSSRGGADTCDNDDVDYELTSDDEEIYENMVGDYHFIDISIDCNAM